MGATILNTESGETITFENCASFHDRFKLESGKPATLDAPLSFYDAARNGDECTSKLAVPPDTVRFQGKVAIFMQYNDHCDSTYLNNYPAIQRVFDSGGLGVLYLDSGISVPGLWHDSFAADYDHVPRRETNGSKVYQMPVLHCGNNYELDSVRNFLNEISNVPANTDPNSPLFQQSFNISAIEDPNHWTLFQTQFGMYQFVMQVLCPLLAFYGIFSAIRYAKVRRKLAKTWWTMPNVALVLESIGLTLTGTFWMVDGFYAVSHSPFTVVRAFMFGNMSFLSVSSFLITGLNFSTFRRSMTRVRLRNVSLTERFKPLIVAFAAFFVIIEAMGGQIRVISYQLAMISNFIAMITNAICIVWFSYECYTFVKLLKVVNSLHHDDAVTTCIRRTIKWTGATVATYVFVLLSVLYFITRPSVFVPQTWQLCFGIMAFFRTLSGVCKIKLLAPPPKPGHSNLNTTSLTFGKNKVSSRSTASGKPGYISS